MPSANDSPFYARRVSYSQLPQLRNMKTRDGLEKMKDPRGNRELFWVSHYTYLAENGYQLRPRYRPDWVPSFLWAPGHLVHTFEDWHAALGDAIDAIRTDDGFAVILKRSLLATPELSMLRFLSWHPETQSPLNHTVPLLHVLPVPHDPGVVIAVMPKMCHFLKPTFHCRREVLECFRQVIEGVGFMHSLNICHGDLCSLSFVMDPREVCPQGFHFACQTDIDGTGNGMSLIPTPRCQCQVKYYIFDFETSQKFVGGRHDALRGIRDMPCPNRKAPELSNENNAVETPYNPFCVDVYNIGAILAGTCDDYFEQLDDLQPFVGRLMAKEPLARPTLEEAMTELLEFIASRSEEWLDTALILYYVSFGDGLHHPFLNRM